MLQNLAKKRAGLGEDATFGSCGMAKMIASRTRCYKKRMASAFNKTSQRLEHAGLLPLRSGEATVQKVGPTDTRAQLQAVAARDGPKMWIGETASPMASGAIRTPSHPPAGRRSAPRGRGVLDPPAFEVPLSR